MVNVGVAVKESDMVVRASQFGEERRLSNSLGRMEKL